MEVWPFWRPFRAFQSTLPVWGATLSMSRDISKESFQSTLPVWGATTMPLTPQTIGLFQSTLPVWGATQRQYGRPDLPGISIHAPRVGSDTCLRRLPLPVLRISIHAPRVGSDSRGIKSPPSPRHFNPRSPCGERQTTGPQGTQPPNFNPRSPCGERHAVKMACCAVADISIHAPRVGSDSDRDSASCSTRRFQSTLPVWGATWRSSTNSPTPSNFNPRSPCGERHEFLDVDEAAGDISIHAPRVGSDQ